MGIWIGPVTKQEKISESKGMTGYKKECTQPVYQ